MPLTTMFEMHDDRGRARRIGDRLCERRQRDGLTLAHVARETGVSAGTIKRFEAYAKSASDTPFRYEPWGAEYLERWLDGTLTPDVITRHDLQRVLERDPLLTRTQVEAILPGIIAIYDRARGER